VPATTGDEVAAFVADYLVWCLGTARGLDLVERARLDVLMRELETQRLLGAADITLRAASLAGGRSVLSIGTHPVDPQTRDLTARLTSLDGGAVIHAAAPVRVEQKDLVTLQREVVARGNRLIAVGLSAALPGAGQIYNEQIWKGVAVAVVEAGLLGAALGFHIAGNDDLDAYRTDTPESVARADDAEDAFRTRNAFLWAALGVWALQVADAAVFGGVRPDVDQRFRDRIGLPGAGASAVGQAR
jgi:hypothetical protein